MALSQEYLDWIAEVMKEYGSTKTAEDLVSLTAQLAARQDLPHYLDIILNGNDS